MSSTFATVAIPAEVQTAAQADLPGHFTTAFSATGAEPATHYVDSGYWFDSELDFIVNTASWQHTVKFGSLEEALAELGLQIITAAQDEETQP